MSLPASSGEFAFDVRAAGPLDAGRIAEHRVELTVGDAGDLPDGGAFETASAEAMRALLATSRAGAWVAVAHGGEIVGSAVLLYVDRLPSRENRSAVEGYLAQLHVVPAWRWRGVGIALMRAAIAEASERRLGRIRLHSTVEALGFYERCGFTARARDLELRL